jgi:SAM-dependent methyltransferase
MTSPYSFPRAKEGVDIRLIHQHETFRQILDGRLLNALVAEPVGRVLDIGTGSGVWAAEFAARHPTAEVVGIDNYPQPTIEAPNNCQFMILDAEREWQVGDAKFDVIHARLVPFHAKEVQAVFRRCYEHLKPGGYVEIQDMLPPIRTDEPAGAPEHSSKVLEWARLRKGASSKLGIESITGRLPEVLSAAGFEDVQTLDLKLPIGAWMDDEKMKRVGKAFLECLQLGRLDLSLELLTHLGMEERQIVDLVEQAGKELGIGKLYTMVRFVWARKPATSQAQFN